MELKDRRVDFFGTKYWLRFMDHIPNNTVPGYDDASCLDGVTNHSGRFIWIATRDCNGNKLNREEIELTVYHELVHAILMQGQYGDLCGNEPLVEWLAKNVRSLVKQKVL